MTAAASSPLDRMRESLDQDWCPVPLVMKHSDLAKLLALADAVHTQADNYYKARTNDRLHAPVENALAALTTPDGAEQPETGGPDG